MNICQACLHPARPAADEMLLAGRSQASVARFLRLDKQVVGRHARNGHVVAPPEPTAAEPAELDPEAAAQVEAATESLALALLGGDRDALAGAQARPSYDWILDRVAEYRLAVLG